MMTPQSADAGRGFCFMVSHRASLWSATACEARQAGAGQARCASSAKVRAAPWLIRPREPARKDEDQSRQTTYGIAALEKVVGGKLSSLELPESNEAVASPSLAGVDQIGRYPLQSRGGPNLTGPPGAGLVVARRARGPAGRPERRDVVRPVGSMRLFTRAAVGTALEHHARRRLEGQDDAHEQGEEQQELHGMGLVC